MRRVRVLLVDDSLFMRLALRRILSLDACFEVIGEAGDGEDAVTLCERLRPDVCTMDLNMPRLDGAQAVREIMRRCPTPVVMLSAHTREGTRQTIEALAAGAVDFVPKPSGEVSADLLALGALLRDKLRVAAASRRPAPSTPPAAPRRPAERPGQICVIALSTGGPQLLGALLPRLPADSKALLVVQHLPAAFTGALAERLASESQVQVREARDGDRPERGLVLVAPGDRHLMVASDGSLLLDDGPERHGVRPAADVTMESAARVYRGRACGLVMTGMGQDGTAGLRAIRAAGGATYAQDQASSLVWGMPRSAIDAGVVDRVVHPDELPELLT